MSRLSREKKREQKQAAHAATPAAPIDVHVPVPGTDVGGGTGGVSDGASVGGVPVFAAPGEEIQRAVLNRLHHIALATGHPVLATIRDERIGYVVPLQVDPDGSSHFTAEPVATEPPERQHARGDATRTPPVPQRARSEAPAPPEPQHVRSEAPAPPERQHARGDATRTPPVPQRARSEASAPPEPQPVRSEAPAPPEPQHVRSEAPAAPEPPHAGGDSATHVLRPAAEPGRGATPTFPLRGVPESQPADEPVPTFELRAVPGRAEPAPEDAPPAPGAAPPGTVAPPTGAFGPPPPMDARPLPVPEAQPVSRPAPVPEDALIAADPDPKPTPPRGFDAVAEAVLGDEPLTAPGDPAAPALLAEPIARINAAVKEGRIEAASGLAEQTLAQASATLGPEHPEVLRLGELTAYIAYLAGDPLRAFRLSLDLAGARRRAGDPEAAYGNVESAATAWRAVRDPALGLELGRDLIGLWTELAAEDGPAAEEVEQLESARARMGRLTERARNQ
ncbi:tetratricopeptide repeat protein [Streptomyces sp. NPDC029044]|uniref:tetratricopeptide repeat protein n=1 Tax=Streptomyces sp. NPDC029044 TaxID=3157198 RepID=UPI0033E2CCC0